MKQSQFIKSETTVNVGIVILNACQIPTIQTCAEDDQGDSQPEERSCSEFWWYTEALKQS